MLCFRRRNAGFSLTEVLVVLAILSLTLAVFASARPGPSPAMMQEKRISALIAEAARAQQAAILQGMTQSHKVNQPLCDQSPDTLIFFANGTAKYTEICLLGAQGTDWLVVDPFTGQLGRRSPP